MLLAHISDLHVLDLTGVRPWRFLNKRMTGGLNLVLGRRRMHRIEVVEAARFSRAQPELKGQDAVRAAEKKSWDPSVKAMLAFPQILSSMDEDLEWMRRLGDAFLAQQEQVMETVQALRTRADEAGNLTFRKTARNFNAPAATCGRICVAEVEEIVPVGSLDPDAIHVPGIYVKRLILGAPYDKKIEFVTTRERESA